MRQLIGLFFVLSLTLMGALVFQTGKRLQQGGAGAELVRGKQLPDFHLTDHNGASFDASGLQGRWSLVYFGFSHCPDVCPISLAHMSRLWQQFHSGPANEDEEASEQTASFQAVFVSVDPDRDTPERLKEFTSYFPSPILGVTGSHVELKKLTENLGVQYWLNRNGEGEAGYEVLHDDKIFLLAPSGRVARVYHGDEDIALLEDALRRVL